MLGFLVKYDRLLEMDAEELGEPAFVAAVIFWHLCAGVLLRQKRKSGRVLATICFIIWLIGFPVGTVLGILGLRWLDKGKHSLR